MIALVAALSTNNCIGTQGKIPWHIREDMQRVKALTVGKVVIMGRRTWESLPKKFRPLPHRTNVVITRQSPYTVPQGVEVFRSIDEALSAHAHEEIIGFGGEQIYRQLIDRADTLYITHVNTFIDQCDAFFPRIDFGIWQEVAREDKEGYSFVEYKKM